MWLRRFWELHDIHNLLGMTYIVYFYWAVRKRDLKIVSENVAILSWHHCPEKKKHLQYLNWSGIDLAVDDVSTPSGILSPGGHWCDYYPDVTFIQAKSLPTKSLHNHWKDQMRDTQLRFCDLAKWYSTYPIDPVVATSGTMPPGLCYMRFSNLFSCVEIARF